MIPVVEVGHDSSGSSALFVTITILIMHFARRVLTSEVLSIAVSFWHANVLQSTEPFCHANVLQRREPFWHANVFQRREPFWDANVLQSTEPFWRANGREPFWHANVLQRREPFRMKKQWHARVRACGVGNSEDHVFHTEPSRIYMH